MIIVCYQRIKARGDYRAFDTMEEAEEFYQLLVHADDTYSASICGVIKSTDYEAYR